MLVVTEYGVLVKKATYVGMDLCAQCDNWNGRCRGCLGTGLVHVYELPYGRLVRCARYQREEEFI